MKISNPFSFLSRKRSASPAPLDLAKPASARQEEPGSKVYGHVEVPTGQYNKNVYGNVANSLQLSQNNAYLHALAKASRQPTTAEEAPDSGDSN